MFFLLTPNKFPLMMIFIRRIGCAPFQAVSSSNAMSLLGRSSRKISDIFRDKELGEEANWIHKKEALDKYDPAKWLNEMNVKTIDPSRQVTASFIACELEEKELNDDEKGKQGLHVDYEWEEWEGYKNTALKRRHLDQDKYKEKAMKLRVELKSILNDNCERLSDSVTNQIVLWALYKGVEGFMDYQKVAHALEEKKKPKWGDDSDSQ